MPTPLLVLSQIFQLRNKTTSAILLSATMLLTYKTVQMHMDFQN